MGEKETVASARAIAGGQVDPTPAQAAKLGQEKKNEEQRYVQDDTPDGEALGYTGKHSPELMLRTPEPPEELSDTGREGGTMDSIRNLKA